MEDWKLKLLEIVLSATVIGFIFKAIDLIRYKKQDKKLKKDEVDKAEVETDRKQIDLGDLFLEKSQKWSEIIESNSMKMMKIMEKMDQDKVERDKDWTELKKDMEYVKTEIGNLVEYNNGGYQDFLKNKYGRKKTTPMPKRRGYERKDVRDVQTLGTNN
jgi:hypothetical protein